MSDDPADLRNLHDIVLPPDVSWWPLAPGWLALAAVVVIVACYYSYRLYSQWRGNAYRRDALAELSTADSPAQIAELLRRTALAVAPRGTIAPLQGDAWIDWLAAQSEAKPTPSVRESLTHSIYKPIDSPTDLSALRDFARVWISRHKQPC